MPPFAPGGFISYRCSQGRCNRGLHIRKMSRLRVCDMLGLDSSLSGLLRFISDAVPALMPSIFIPPGLLPVGGLLSPVRIRVVVLGASELDGFVSFLSQVS